MKRPPIPAVLILCAAVVAAAALWFPTAETQPVDVAIDLRAGARTTIEFRAARSLQHAIGIEMDRQTAERLFPCTAGLDYFGPADKCPGARLPISLDISLFETNNPDHVVFVNPNSSESGGSYVMGGTHQTYTWPAAYADLLSGHHYTMVLRSLTDGTAALPAHPRLTVEVSAIDTTGEATVRSLVFWVASIVGALGCVWTLIRFVLSRRHREAA